MIKITRLPAALLRVCIFCVCVFFIGAGRGEAASARPWWFSLEQGKHLFRAGNYGAALNAFENARRDRRETFTRMRDNFIILLSNPQVRPRGDALDLVELYITEHSELDAAEALNELYAHIPRARLENSVTKALAALALLQHYPEAEYWIGETCFVEGEIGIALMQYQKSYEHRELFEAPGFRTEVLYKIAEMRRLQKKYAEMERALLDILSRGGEGDTPLDELWEAESNTRTRRAMAQILGRADGLGRFLSLYRYGNTSAERAHRALGFFYYESGRYMPGPALEHLMFSFLIQSTVVIDEIKRRQYDYEFSTLEDMMTRLRRIPAALDYLDKNEYYRVLYCLGCAFFGADNPAGARQFWAFLAAEPLAGQWQPAAARQLASPQIERPVLGSAALERR
ncbi:MAG: hypothetical protein LBR16_07335 [Treponema sp.]|nr:hypothetical protein [Treponema sp.]